MTKVQTDEAVIKKNPIKAQVLTAVTLLAAALTVLVLVFTFVVRVAAVNGISMENTLQPGDRLLLQSVGYTPQRGDVVVTDDLIDYGKPLVKRVIALGGDVVDIDFQTGAVTVNGVTLEEPYIRELTLLDERQTFPLTVPQGKLFLMRDNRCQSKDSRSPEIGCIDERDILGKAILRIFPLQKIGVIQSWKMN